MKYSGIKHCDVCNLPSNGFPSNVWEIVKDREAWSAAVHRVLATEQQPKSLGVGWEGGEREKKMY